MSGAGDLILNDVFAGKTPPQGPAAHREPINSRLLYFDMEIDQVWDQKQTCYCLEPGVRYTITVFIASKSQLADDKPRMLRGSRFALELALEHDPGFLIPCLQEESHTPTPFADIADDPNLSNGETKVEFVLELPMDCPKVATNLTLHLVREGRRHGPPIDQRPVLLMGTRLAQDTDIQAVCCMDPEQTVPDHVGFLYVEEQPNVLILKAWHQQRCIQETVSRPDLCPAPFIDGRGDPAELFKRIRAFSRRHIQNLQAWLHDFIKRDTPPVLVITDFTSAEIPWEMMELADNRFLGVETLVSRWPGISYFYEGIPLGLNVANHHGRVFSYLDDAVQVDGERTALAQLNAVPLDSAKAVLECLDNPSERISLMYIGCHGFITYDDPVKERRQGLEAINHDRPLLTMDVELLARGNGPLPLMVVNACHSGRLLKDDSGIYGLPEVFLARAVRGYVGSLAAVDQTKAANWGASLLNLLHSHPEGISLSEALRRLRAEAVKGYRRTQTDEETWFHMLMHFVYVYYGDPMVNLCRHPDKEAQA